MMANASGNQTARQGRISAQVHIDLQKMDKCDALKYLMLRSI
jgi:hypothetical protein